jgi:hypothetical protein
MKQFLVTNSRLSQYCSLIPFSIIWSPRSVSFQDLQTLPSQFQDENEKEYVYQSLFFLAKSFFFGYQKHFNPFQALPLFRECAEIDFEDSFFYYFNF